MIPTPRISHLIGRSVWFLPTFIHLATHKNAITSATKIIIPFIVLFSERTQLINGSKMLNNRAKLIYYSSAIMLSPVIRAGLYKCINCSTVGANVSRANFPSFSFIVLSVMIKGTGFVV